MKRTRGNKGGHASRFKRNERAVEVYEADGVRKAN